MSHFSTNKSTFKKIVDEENIYKAYKQTQKGKGKYKSAALRFAQDETYNLKKLRMSLIEGSYRFDGYTRFRVYEPKERIIDAPGYKDKIVQIAINNVLKEIYYPSFIYDSYACLDNKGTHKCADRIQRFLKRAKWKYGEEAYVAKLDMREFFYSINREVLKGILKKKIICEKTLSLLFQIIDSAKIIDPLGLPLGNTLSQIAANIYMNQVDQYAKRNLSLKYYARYADDIVIVLQNKEKACEAIESITDFVNKNLKIDTNKNKTKVFPINQGINSIGYKIYSTHSLLRNDSKKKIKRKAKKMRRLIMDGRLEKEKAEQILNSWLGHAKHSNSINFIDKLIKNNNYLYLDSKGTLKVNLKKLREG